MTNELKALKLGNNHFYFMSDRMAILIRDYEKMDDTQRSNIYSSPDGDTPLDYKKIKVNTIKNRPECNYFYGRRRFWADQKSKYKTGKEKVILTDDIREMFSTIEHICDLHHTANSAHVLIPESALNNPEVINFMNYIQITR